MVLGLRANSRRSPTLQRNYLIRIQEIQPWPPCQSLRTLRSILIQWEHGEQSGFTNTVIPLLGPGIGDGKIEFSESFRLSVNLVKDTSGRGGESATFQKSCLELNLYEPRRDKTIKGQLLGTAVVDFADYGLVKEAQSISVPINSKRIYSNTAKPLLYLEIQTIDRGRTSTSSRNSLSRVFSMEKNGGESVSALMNEEYAEEAETASVSDDDVSSRSSISSPLETNDVLFLQTQEAASDSPREDYDLPHLSPNQQQLKTETKPVEDVHETLKNENGAISGSEVGSRTLHGYEENTLNDSLINVASADHDLDEKLRAADCVDSQAGTVEETVSEDLHKPTSIGVIHNDPVKNTDRNEYQKKGQVEVLIEGKYSNEDARPNEFSEIDLVEQGSSASDAFSLGREKLVINSETLKISRLNHVKSVRSSGDSSRSTRSFRNGRLGDAKDGLRDFASSEIKETNVYNKETRDAYSDGRIIQLEHRIKMLEGELREVAAIEVALYSIIAEHGSSTNKVHAPARRLSRLYLHTCKESSKSRRAGAARGAVSGLVVVAKACGNDVPRLTYWLSNSILLRAILEQQLPLCARPLVERPSGLKKVSPLKWESSSIMESTDAFCGGFDDWEDPRTFISALERIEAWIFSRVIESIWWQTLTPHMQSAAAKAINTEMVFGNSKTFSRTSSSGDQGQVNVSLELWKNAFRDACERLCPVRAGGHDCGCLPMLARLIMEQCVARLDVAMFNAILRESDDDIPTDPVSDPISDAKVLPIPTGKASFGAGAQLKNAIGNWSRWLSDLFGIDYDLHEEKNVCGEDDGNDSIDYDTSSKCFHHLNALSDLMMLPKDMLLSRSIRKEVCPTFGPPLIKRVLSNFVPDEFCPDPIPNVVLEALDSKDSLEEGEDSVSNFPCSAAPVVYTPPAATSLGEYIGESGCESQLRRSGSSVLKKSYTSEDELDELGSPLATIINDFQTSASPNGKSKDHDGQIAVRYQLLREVWLSSD